VLLAHIHVLALINLALSFGEVLLEEVEKALAFLFGQSSIPDNDAAEVVEGFSHKLAVGRENLSLSDIGEINNRHLF
jgi:hypothetical protein